MTSKPWVEQTFKKRRNAMIIGASLIPILAFSSCALTGNINRDIEIQLFLCTIIPSIIASSMITYIFTKLLEDYVLRLNLGLGFIPLGIGIFSTILFGGIGLVILIIYWLGNA